MTLRSSSPRFLFNLEGVHKSKNIFRREQREENDYKRKHLAGIVSISFNGHQAKKRFHLATKKSLEQIVSPKKTDFTREFWPPKKLDLSKISKTNGQFSGQDPLCLGYVTTGGVFETSLQQILSASLGIWQPEEVLLQLEEVCFFFLAFPFPVNSIGQQRWFAG